MKKILLVFDGNHFSEGAFAFARELNEKSPILLTGVFLPQADFVDLWSYTDGAMIGPLFLSRIEGEEPGKLEKNITHFETLCLKNGIDFRVHKDFNELVLPELIKETRFADLLIIGSESFFASLGTHEPNDFLKDTLHAQYWWFRKISASQKQMCLPMTEAGLPYTPSNNLLTCFPNLPETPRFWYMQKKMESCLCQMKSIWKSW